MTGQEPTLRTSVERLAALMSGFVELLGLETKALGERNADALHAVAERKLELGADVERATTALEQALRGAGLPAGRGGLARALASAELRAIWRQVRRDGKRCAQLNRANGAVIELSRAFNTTLLNLICGREQSCPTYTRAGRVDGAAEKRALARV